MSMIFVLVITGEKERPPITNYPHKSPLVTFDAPRYGHAHCRTVAGMHVLLERETFQVAFYYQYGFRFFLNGRKL